MDEAQNALSSKNFVPTSEQISGLKSWFASDSNKKPSTENMTKFINLSKGLGSEASLRERKVASEMLPQL